MREITVENYFNRRIRALGGTTRKVKWLGVRGAPDRIPLLPCDPRPTLVELKRPGEKPEAHQLIEHEVLRRAGYRVLVIDSKEAVDSYYPLTLKGKS